MHDDGESVDRLSGNQDVELDHRRFPKPGEVVIERSVAARDRFEPVVEVENNFVQRQFVVQHDARGADIFECLLLAALFFDQRENSADVFFVGKNGGKNHRLFDFGNLAGIKPARGIVDLDHLAIGLGDLVTHAGSGGDEIETKFALQTLLDDFHVQQAKETAAKAEAESNRTLGLEEKGRIVEAKFFERLPQHRVLVGIHGVESREDHGLDVFESGQRFDGRIRVIGDGVADLGVGNVLDVGDNESDFSRDELVDLHRLGRQHAESLRVEGSSVPHEADSLTLAQGSLKDAGEDDDAAVGVEPRVEH